MTTESYIHIRVFKLATRGKHVGEYVHPQTEETFEAWIEAERKDGYYFQENLMATCGPDRNFLRVVTRLLQ